MAPAELLHSRLPDESSPGSRWLRFLIGLLLAYTAWFWAGLRPSFHWVGVGVAVLLLIVLAASGRSSWRWLTDPVFWLGLTFLIFLALQWINAGRDLYFDVGFQRWMYTPPPRPGWPSAYAREDALQMMTWFFPAWVVAVTIRSGRLRSPFLHGLLLFTVANAAILSLFGIVQFASGTSAIYWVQPLRSHFFASFGYGNHAPPYFVMTGALAAGLLYRDLFDSRRHAETNPLKFRVNHPWRITGLAVALVLCLVGANLGLSRTGIILAAVLGVFVAVYGGGRGWRILQPAQRVNFLAAGIAVAGGLYFVVAGLGETRIQKELSLKEAAPGTIQTIWDRLDLELGGRHRFARAAVQVWLEQPWFGHGGWGFKYRVAEYVPERLWDKLETRGWANVHVDVLQFLAEFGVVGMSLLLGAMGVMLRDWFRPVCRRDALWTIGGVGMVLLMGFSLIDLPFRSPAILYTWIVMLTAIPRICGCHRNGFENRPVPVPERTLP